MGIISTKDATNLLQNQINSISTNISLQEISRYLNRKNAIFDQIKSLETYRSLRDLHHSLNSASAIFDQIKNSATYNPLKALNQSVTSASAIFAQLRDVEKYNPLRGLSQSITSASAVFRQMNNLEASSSWKKLTESVTVANSLAEYLKELRVESPLQQWAKSIATSSEFTDSLECFRREEYLESLFENIERHSHADANIESELDDIKDCDVNSFLRKIATTETSNGFSEIFAKAPRILKFLILVYLIPLLYNLTTGAIGGVMGNFATPIIESYLNQGKNTSQREQINNIKKLSFSDLGIELSNYRFVTTTTLYIRTNPNARSPIVGELKFGQVICVLSTKRDWTEVAYEYGDDTKIFGWVFTRHTAKFRK